MAMVNFDLADLYLKAFGRPTEAFKPNLDPAVGDTAGARTEVSSTGAAYYALAPNGQEYFMPVSFMIPSEASTAVGLIPDAGGGVSSTGAAPVGKLVEYRLPFPIISMTGRKTIIRTPLTERRGEVSELINLKGYDITIRGFIVSETNDYPEAEVALLRNLYEQNTAISIKSAYTDIWLMRRDRKGSDDVVIEELRLPERVGVKHVVAYELKIVSDEIFNLTEI